MKILKRLSVLSLFAILSFLLIGCGSNKLAAPTEIEIKENTLVLSWNTVEHATNYIVSANGKDYIVSKNTFDLVSLAPGDYTLKVKSRDAQKKYSDSSWSKSVSFTRESENGLVYTLTNANTEYSVTSAGTASGDVEIGDYYNGKPITSIGDKAFSNASSLKTIKIGNNVKKVGDNAFTNCSNLESIEFGENVATIGEYAFQGCRGLKSVTLPDGLTEVSRFAFRYCRNLVSVTFGKSVKSINEGAFASCDQLVSLDLPESVEQIGKNAFASCSALLSVNLGNGAKSIGVSAFSGDTSIVDVDFGENLQTIGESAFFNCKSLVSVTLPQTLASIGDSAFYNCEKLENVSLPDTLGKIGASAFLVTKAIGSNVNNGVCYVGNWAVGYTDELAKGVALLSTTVGIADDAFKNAKLTSVLIPDSVLTMGDNAFQSCADLTQVTIGKGITKISKNAFQGCTSLGKGKVSIGENVTEIGNYAFYGCKMLGDKSYLKAFPFNLPENLCSIGTYAFKNTGFWDTQKSGAVYVGSWLVGYISDGESDVKVKEGTIGIANYAFYKSESLEVVTLPDSLQYLGKGAFSDCAELVRAVSGDFSVLTEIQEYAFYNCTALVEVDIPVKVEKIGRSAFYKSGLQTVTIPYNVTEIAPYAFYGCTNLKEITFKASAADGKSALKTIGDYAFGKAFAPELESIVLPDGIETIGERAFFKCEGLKSIVLGNTLADLGLGAFEGCVSLEEITLPDSLEVLPSRVFSKCSALTKVVFGNNLKEIGNQAFYKCSALAEVNLPESVEIIGDYAFRNCAIKVFYIGSNVKETGAHVFNGNAEITLYLQSESVPEGWSARWNSAYRPVIFGSSLSENGEYIEKIVVNKDSILNESAKNGITPPQRNGYKFICWRTADGTETYDMTTVKNAPDGTTLYAEWKEYSGEEESPDESAAEESGSQSAE